MLIALNGLILVLRWVMLDFPPSLLDSGGFCVFYLIGVKSNPFFEACYLCVSVHGYFCIRYSNKETNGKVFLYEKECV